MLSKWACRQVVPAAQQACQQRTSRASSAPISGLRMAWHRQEAHKRHRMARERRGGGRTGILHDDPSGASWRTRGPLGFQVGVLRVLSSPAFVREQCQHTESAARARTRAQQAPRDAPPGYAGNMHADCPCCLQVVTIWPPQTNQDAKLQQSCSKVAAKLQQSCILLCLWPRVRQAPRYAHGFLIISPLNLSLARALSPEAAILARDGSMEEVGQVGRESGEP